jgi:hypothetical protein
MRYARALGIVRGLTPENPRTLLSGAMQTVFTNNVHASFGPRARVRLFGTLGVLTLLHLAFFCGVEAAGAQSNGCEHAASGSHTDRESAPADCHAGAQSETQEHGHAADPRGGGDEDCDDTALCCVNVSATRPIGVTISSQTFSGESGSVTGTRAFWTAPLIVSTVVLTPESPTLPPGSGPRISRERSRQTLCSAVGIHGPPTSC